MEEISSEEALKMLRELTEGLAQDDVDRILAALTKCIAATMIEASTEQFEESAALLRRVSRRILWSIAFAVLGAVQLIAALGLYRGWWG